MRRLVVESEAATTVGAGFSRVRDLLGDLPRAMRLVSVVGLVEPLTAGERSFDPAQERYRVHLGPFGAGGFSGTLRLVLEVRRNIDDDRYALQMTTLPDRGNADLTIDVEARPSELGARVHCRVQASPRKEVPALLPMGVVRLGANRILKAAIEGGLRSAADSLALA